MAVVSQPSVFGTLLGDTLVTKTGVQHTSRILKRKRFVALYFSASWCPPCRAFTPVLREFYEECNADNSDEIEIVFVSSDKNMVDYDEYFSHMSWVALPFEKRDVKESLSSKFSVRGIPMLVILDGTTGRICSTKARNDVLQATPGERNACLKAWTNMSASASSTNTFDPGEGSLCTVS